MKNTTEIAKSSTVSPRVLLNVRLNIINKKNNNGLSTIMGSGKTLTNNETKNIVKVIRSLENTVVLSIVTRNNIV